MKIILFKPLGDMGENLEEWWSEYEDSFGLFLSGERRVVEKERERRKKRREIVKLAKILGVDLGIVFTHFSPSPQK